MTLPAQKIAEKPAASEERSMLSFVPAGLARSIAEYVAASVPGAALLFAFFVLALIAKLAIKNDLLAFAFLPVICIMPVLSGAVSTLVLEKIRSKPLTLQRGATVGAASGLSGSLLSAVLLGAGSLANFVQPFGSGITGILLAAALLAIVAIDTLLSALGGALVVKFIKDM